MSTITIANIPVLRNTHFPGYISDPEVHLTPVQMQALNDLYQGLSSTNATLNDGTPITSYDKAIRWIFDQITTLSP